MEITMWMAYVFLAIAVGTETVATSTLPATMCFTKLKPSLVCIICYVICFYSLGMSLTHIPMGIAYGTHAFDRLHRLPAENFESRLDRRGADHYWYSSDESVWLIKTTCLFPETAQPPGKQSRGLL